MIQILLDSAADYDIRGKEGFGLVPISVSIGEKDYQDGIDLNKDTFYDLLISGKDFPKTAQPSPQIFAEVFQAAKERGDQVVYFALSSALSGTYQSAVIAKEMVDYDGIHLVDTLTATVGISVLANHAERMREEGASAAEIVCSAEELKEKIRIFAAVDTLEYLYRGGRLSRGAAAVGTVAGVKPTITVSREGTVSVTGKCLGRGRAMQNVVKSASEVQRDKRFPVYTLFSYGEENCEILEGKLAEVGLISEGRMQIGSTIGAHVGPGAYGVILVER